MNLNFHGTDDRLEEYVFGRLPHPDLPALEEHLMICAACRDKLDSFEVFAVGMKQALEPGPLEAGQGVLSPAPARADWFPSLFPKWLRQPAFPLALGMMALVASIGVVSNGRAKFAPAATLQLTASRGEMPLAAPARELDLTLSDAPPEDGALRVEIVNATGKVLWSGPAGVHIKAARPFGPGDYFVRLYSASGKMLREYGFRIRP